LSIVIHTLKLCFFALLLGAAWTIYGEPAWDTLMRVAEQRYSNSGHQTLLQWRKLVEDNADEPETTQLLKVNDFFNERIRFGDDNHIWGQKDYWATPLETMGTAQGDCEDFSIAKYITLLNLGVDDAKMRLTYVKATLTSGKTQAHMVLVYYPSPSSEPLVLDNLSLEILPASQRVDLRPVFSFNSGGLWVGSGAEPEVKNPETRLSRWRDVLLRMQQEGF